LAAKYDQRFDGEYQLDNATGIAVLSHPTEALKNFKVTMKPMLGCISVAPAGLRRLLGHTLGLMAAISITTARFQGRRCSSRCFIRVRCSGSGMGMQRWPMAK
jgi:hypothetical protein